MAVQMRPVQNLEEPLDPIVAQAKLTLDQELLSLLKKGWEFNIEDNRVLSADAVTGEVAVPDEVIAIDFRGGYRTAGRATGSPTAQPTQSSTPYRLTVRQQKIYDSTQRTFAIGQSIHVDVMVSLDFNDCPPAIQEAAKWRACRRFYVDVRGETQTTKEIAAREAEAWADLQREDIRSADPWIGNSSLVARTITRRRRRWTWVS